MVITSKTKEYFVAILLFALIFTSCGQENKEELKVNKNLSWSARLAESFILRHPGSVTYDQYYTKDKWNYEQGVILEGLRQVYELTGEEKYFDFVKNNIDQYVNDFGKIRTYSYDDFNLDQINAGKQLLFLYAKTNLGKYKIAADSLRKQLENQPRTENRRFLA